MDSNSKEFYTLSKKFEYHNYNLVYELIQNTSRSVVTLALIIFDFKLKTMIYITLVFMAISALVDVNQRSPYKI